MNVKDFSQIDLNSSYIQPNSSDFKGTELFFSDSNSVLYCLVTRKDVYNNPNNYYLISYLKMNGYANGVDYDYRLDLKDFISNPHLDVSTTPVVNNTDVLQIVLPENHSDFNVMFNTTNFMTETGFTQYINTLSNGYKFITDADKPSCDAYVYSYFSLYVVDNSFTFPREIYSSDLYTNSYFMLGFGQDVIQSGIEVFTGTTTTTTTSPPTTTTTTTIAGTYYQYEIGAGSCGTGSTPVGTFIYSALPNLNGHGYTCKISGSSDCYYIGGYGALTYTPQGSIITNVYNDCVDCTGILPTTTTTTTATPTTTTTTTQAPNICFNIGSGFTIDINRDVNVIKTFSDNKILVGGDFTSYSGQSYNRIIKLNYNGYVDNSFNALSGFNGAVFDSVIQTDGKILVGGAFTTYSGQTYNRIIRLNGDGSIDNSFNIGTGFNNSVFSLYLQNDGRILVGGFFGSYSGQTLSGLVRLNSDGSIDNTFNTGSFSIGVINNIEVQSDNKILVGGWFTSYSGQSYNRIIRLNSGGTIDSSFVIGTGFNDIVQIIKAQSDGKILVGGNFTSYSGQTYNKFIRLNTNGTIDNSFAIGTGFSNNVLEIELQSDGKILVGGEFTSYSGQTYNRIVRLNSGGTIDSSFSIGTGFNNTVKTIKVQSDNKILVGGAFTTYNSNSSSKIVRLFNNGATDNCDYITTTTTTTAAPTTTTTTTTAAPTTTTTTTTVEQFNIGSGFTGDFINCFVSSIIIQNDGKILTSGDYLYYNNLYYNRINRLNSDGSIDNNFSGLPIFNNTLYTIENQSDGKILYGGAFTQYGDQNYNRIIRINSGGTIDSSFNVGTGFNNQVRIIRKQSDGKILVGGWFTIYNGTSSNYIIRLNSNGSIDSSFNVGTGFNGQIYSIEVQSDGKILIGGSFTSYNGTSSNNIIRLNSNGTVDSSFSIGTGFNNIVSKIAIQSDNKILVGGYFTNYSGQTYVRLIRLNSGGTIDSSFSNYTDFNDNVSAIAIQSDGKILVGGWFNSYDSQTYNHIVRLNSGGTIDSSFNIGTGFNNYVYDIKIQSNNKILICGNFTLYKNQVVNRIIRLNTDGISNTIGL